MLSYQSEQSRLNGLLVTGRSKLILLAVELDRDLPRAGCVLSRNGVTRTTTPQCRHFASLTSICSEVIPSLRASRS